MLSFIAMVAAVIYGSDYTTRFYLADIAERGQSTLRLSVAGLESALSRYEYLPGLLAKDTAIRQFLVHPTQIDRAGKANVDLKRIAQETGAETIFLLDRKGAVLASSDYDSAQSFVYSSFAHKPYFQSAIAGKIGHYFSVDSPAGDRGFYLAAPIAPSEDVIGVVAVKVDIENIETAWTSPAHEILVTDENSIVFMASKPAWRFRSLFPITGETRATLDETKQYGDLPIPALKVKFGGNSEAYDAHIGRDAQLIAIARKSQTDEYVAQKMSIPTRGWTVHVFSKTDSAQTQAVIFTIIAALLILILVMFLVFLWQRRARLVERIALQRDAQDMLEKRVEERTASLNQANSQLVLEVSERQAAEQELRKTQEDLIQAGKLAALGQMSTALSHEFNQPLAAIRSYADNADILLERDRVPEARDNVQRISALTDRMASISKHLRNFARKPGEKMGSVCLKDVVRDTLELLAGKISSAGVEVILEIDNDDLLVQAGYVRLQQVLVNLTSNAVDAMQDGPQAVLELRANRSTQEGWVELTVRDRGAGVSEDVIARVFDPFFTTKGVGQGLGLGLSISFNIIKDFGGALRVENHPEGGAVFSVLLKEADQSIDGAEVETDLPEGIAAE